MKLEYVPCISFDSLKVNGMFKTSKAAIKSCRFGIQKEINVADLVSIFCGKCLIKPSVDSNNINQCPQCDLDKQYLDLSFIQFSLDVELNDGIQTFVVAPFRGNNLFNFTPLEFKSRSQDHSFMLTGSEVDDWFFSALVCKEFSEITFYKSIEIDDNDFLVSTTNYFISSSISPRAS